MICDILLTVAITFTATALFFFFFFDVIFRKRINKTGCDYCNSNKPLTLDNHCDWIYIKDNYIESNDWDFKINYCPMCGRKLKK